jgi:aryl-alcohol dehydrogenase-like predicted oxidoreductase
MKLRRLGNTGLQVSELCLGAMNFGNQRIGVGEEESRRVIDTYVARGGNFIDTADAYAGGVSEEIVGRALKGRRDQIVVATKGHYPIVPNFGDPPAHANALGSSRVHLHHALDASLRRLGTDYLDLYQVHCWDQLTPIEETLSTLDGFVRSGKVRHVGLSNWSAWQIAEARQLCIRNGWEPFVTAQMQYSLVCRDIEQDVMPACRRHGIGILPWSPLGQGVLTAKYRESKPAQGRFAGEPPNAAAAGWRARFLNERTERIVDAVSDVASHEDSSPTAVSLAWLLTREGVSSVIIGPKTVEQLEQNLDATAMILGLDSLNRLEAASEPPPRYPEWFISNSVRNQR